MKAAGVVEISIPRNAFTHRRSNPPNTVIPAIRRFMKSFLAAVRGVPAPNQDPGNMMMACTPGPVFEVFLFET